MSDTIATRDEAKSLPAGSAKHYSAYVGPPTEYDLMGATQFRLLTTLGLRETHQLLDFGCGSLRAGRLFIPYLSAGKYFGVEPNSWLVKEAITHEIGQDQIRLKSPTFLHNDDFTVTEFGVKFDYILAQSIFSHTGRALSVRLLANLRDGLKDDGLLVFTFCQVAKAGVEEFAGDGWRYPGVVAYHPETILGFIREAGLQGISIPWYHPRQQWYVAALSRDRLPRQVKFAHLSGGVLGVPNMPST